MLSWAKWIWRLVPIAYGFEALMINEFAGRDYICSSFIPSGSGYNTIANQICSAQGSVVGESSVSGTRYLEIAYNYVPSHKWVRSLFFP
jgi:ATP-binding cassette subfamily G (WHITE) protein 2 (PDR)